MQDVHRIAHVETPGVAVCAWRTSPSASCRAAQGSERIVGDLERRRHLRQRPAVGAADPQLTVRVARDLEALLVHGAVVPATQHREVGQRCGAALRPVLDVMSLADPPAAAREATAAVAMLQRSA